MNFPELKDDAAKFYEWAERVAPEQAYGISFHLFEVRRALDNLNQAITQTLKSPNNGTQSNSRTK